LQQVSQQYFSFLTLTAKLSSESITSSPELVTKETVLIKRIKVFIDGI